VSFTDIKHGLSDAQKDDIKKSGVVVVAGAVPKEVYSLYHYGINQVY
jgi:hypothetical protein